MWCMQEIDRINKQLNLIADRNDDIKDLRTRHELTVKRNAEVRSMTRLLPKARDA